MMLHLVFHSGQLLSSELKSKTLDVGRSEGPFSYISLHSQPQIRGQAFASRGTKYVYKSLFE